MHPPAPLVNHFSEALAVRIRRPLRSNVCHRLVQLADIHHIIVCRFDFGPNSLNQCGFSPSFNQGNTSIQGTSSNKRNPATAIPPSDRSPEASSLY